MDRGEVGDKRGSKEMDRCPLTVNERKRKRICHFHDN
jgi:hypothetical protein